MKELASSTELTVTKFVEGFTDLGLKVGGEMFLALQFVVSVGERAFGFELALAGHLPVSAHLSLELHLVLLDEALSLLLGLKVLLGLFEALMLRILSRKGTFGRFGDLKFLYRTFVFFSDERLYLGIKGRKLRSRVQVLGILGMRIIGLELLVVGMEGGREVGGSEEWEVLVVVGLEGFGGEGLCAKSGSVH